MMNIKKYFLLLILVFINTYFAADYDIKNTKISNYNKKYSKIKFYGEDIERYLRGFKKKVSQQ